MTVDDEARTAFETLGFDRDDLLVAAKCVAQRVIDNSQEEETPLNGLVYDVWGLYNDGSPKCRWTAPYDNDDVVFTGQFRVEGQDAFVVRRKVLPLSDIESVVRDLRSNGVSM
jgi:hypothetical protein